MNLDTDAPARSNLATTPKLDDTETIILIAAANREDGIALPTPETVSTPPEQVARKIRRSV